MVLQSDTTTDKKEIWALAAIMLFGMALRLHHLGTPCFWVDEVFQARSAMQPTFRLAIEAIPYKQTSSFLRC